jgi:hypothetical protein
MSLCVSLNGNITDTNFTERQRLCAEFGLSEFSKKLSMLSQLSEDSQKRQLGNTLSGVQSSHLNESFQIIANGFAIESDSAEAEALFPAVRERLSVDFCARKFFFVKDRDIVSLEFTRFV